MNTFNIYLHGKKIDTIFTKQSKQECKDSLINHDGYSSDITIRQKHKRGWKIYVNYGHGHGWELECIEETKSAFLENKKAYLTNCNYPIKTSYGIIKD
jgi:hypothetical protein